MKELVVLLLLCACAVGPDYKKPELHFSDLWNFRTADDVKITQAETTSGVLAENSWWQNFNDPVLNELINEAVAKNYDLKTAISRVSEARGNRLTSVAAFLPDITGTASAGRSKQLAPFVNKPLTVYQADFDSSWEIDIFGGKRRQYEAAADLVAAAKAEQKNVLISLRAEVARNYMEVRNYQTQIKITLDNIKSQKQSLDLTTSQREAGIVGDLDVSQAQSLYFSTNSRLPVFQTSLEQAKNNLSALLGEQPGKLDALLNQAQEVPLAANNFLIATPAEIIARRPDVKSAERNLAAATALQGAAIADYFPKISLPAFFGYQHYYPLFQGANLWSYAGNVTMPLLDFGRVHAEVKIADARQEQAFNTYQQTILNALSEVQTNLTAYVNEVQRYKDLTNAVASNQRAVALSKARYDTGIAAFTDVLLAQSELYNVQSQMVQSAANIAEDLVALNKSLGR